MAQIVYSNNQGNGKRRTHTLGDTAMNEDYRWTTQYDNGEDIYGEPVPNPDHPFFYDTEWRRRPRMAQQPKGDREMYEDKAHKLADKYGKDAGDWCRIYYCGQMMIDWTDLRNYVTILRNR